MPMGVGEFRRLLCCHLEYKIIFTYRTVIGIYKRIAYLSVCVGGTLIFSKPSVNQIF